MSSPETKPKSASRAAQPPGEILAGAVYAVEDFRARQRIGIQKMRRLERLGLRVLRVEKKKFILGKDWIRFLIKQSGKEAPSLYGCCKQTG